MFLFRFHALSQTLSPILKGVNFDLIWFFIVNLASLCAAAASSLALTRLFSLFSTASRSVLLVMLGSACGSYPMMSWNGDLPVEEWGQVLCTNLAIGM